MIAGGRTVEEIAAVGNGWLERIRSLRPENVLELGTGQGASGALIMSALRETAIFTTINYPLIEDTPARKYLFGEQLGPWLFDQRLRMIEADTIDPNNVTYVPDGVDLLFIDTTHEAWHAAAELRLWQHKLQDGAIVIVDDLNQHDMMDFWDSLPYEKSSVGGGTFQGVFRYDASKRYNGYFNRPDKTTYGGDK